MHDTVIITIAWATIITLVFLIALLLLASVFRRALNARKYRRLDQLRDHYDRIIKSELEAGNLAGTQAACAAPEKSDAWKAVEDVLLRLAAGHHQDEAKQLLARLGYIAHYEKNLTNRITHVRAMSIDKLGKVKSGASVPKLIALLDEDNPEIVSVTVRALSKIGGRESLQAIVARFPALLGEEMIARKTLHTALLAFGADAIPLLVGQDEAKHGPRVVSSKLEILSRLPAQAGAVDLAVRHLRNENAEVRSKALKVLGRAECNRFATNLPELIIPLLQDPVWYVRLQALRSVGALKRAEAVGATAKLIYDRNWQVRNEAARTVIVLGPHPLDIILDVLNSADRYAKDSVCEEIERTGLSARLIENLGGDDVELQKKSRQILDVMCSLGFSATLEAYLGNGVVGDGAGRVRETFSQGTPL